MVLTAQLQAHVVNDLDSAAAQRKWVAGIIGDRPSQYAKSPSLWNAAFDALALDAVFLPFDVEPAHLAPLLGAMRRTEGFIGGSVTVPFKVAVIEHLDDLDEKARQIGAVNTIARTKEGRLVGYNTDGQGFLDMVTKPLPGRDRPFVPELSGRKVVLVGAGGAARAVAFFLAEALGPRGQIIIANRTMDTGRGLATAVSTAYGLDVRPVAETELRDCIGTADLVINASTKGQSGIRRLAGPRMTCLEPYLAVAPAEAVELPAEEPFHEARFLRAWAEAAAPGIEANLRAAHQVFAAAPASTAFVDLIYAPLETRMLATARLRGHPTVNGREMNVRQAADGFVNRVMAPHLRALGWDLNATYARVADVMSRIW